MDAVALVQQNKNAAFPAMAKWYGIRDPEKQQYFYRDVAKLPRKPYPAVEGIKKVMEIYNYHEMAKHQAEDFYDDSLLRELDQSGYIDSLYR